MFDKFGEFDSAEEINATASGLKEEEDFDNIMKLAEENGIDAEMARLFISGDIDFLCDPMSAAIGKLDIEASGLKCVEIMADWVDYIKSQCMENEKMSAAVRSKGKTLKGCIAALLTWSFKNQNTVDDEILKAAGVKGRCTLGIPGMGRAKKIITEYYLGKQA